MLPTRAGTTFFFRTFMKKLSEREKWSRKTLDGSVMGICGGLVGPKSGNVEKVLVFKCFFEGSRVQKGFCEYKEFAEKGDFGSILGSLWGHFGHIDVEWQA